MKSNDWIGNASFKNCNIRSKNAEKNDFYATDPKAVKLLLQRETFAHKIWEPACGQGHISDVLKRNGYEVLSTDIVPRGYGQVKDFFKCETADGADIITNPPYKYNKEFVEHAIKICSSEAKIAMFLKLTFLEGKERKELFLRTPPEPSTYARQDLNVEKTGFFLGTRLWRMRGLFGKKGVMGKPM